MLNQILQDILSEYSIAEIIQMCKIINKDYNIYDPHEVRWAKLAYVFNRTTDAEWSKLKNNSLSNTVVNDLIFNYYFCERVIKYHFIRHLQLKNDHIVAFEMSIGDSRIDICRINGSSYAYEIKTEYDTFDRLESQMHDYLKTFEKVYVIVPNTRVNEVALYIPASCGIISYRVDKKMNVVFSYSRKAQKNICDLAMCIRSLSSVDMSYMLKLLKLGNYKTRAEKMNVLLRYSSSKSFSKHYRQLLKHKYGAQWDFIIEHFNDILPIDIQSFFSSNINPNLLYTK